MAYKIEHEFLYCVGSMAKPTFESTLKEIPNLGMILSPMSWRNPFCHFACDNDVFNAFNKGILWNEEMNYKYMSMLEKLNNEQTRNLLLWVLSPDAVGDWESTIKLAKKYVPLLQSKGLPVAIALQDGCKFDEALAFSPDCVFVAGSTEWKLKNIKSVCNYFKPHGISVHVGRVNTRRRLIHCKSSGADSADGTVLNRFRNKNIRMIRNVLQQNCFQLEGDNES